MYFETLATGDGKRRKRRRGFSLVEVMIVIVIMGLLAGVVTVNVRGYLTKAKQNTARNEIATIVKALDTYYGMYSKYPDNNEGIGVLTKASEKIPESLLSAEPVDPWGNPYQYNSPGTDGPYDVICYGADGREGGQGVDADITSNALKETVKP
jgi:general secretion pathway protein G